MPAPAFGPAPALGAGPAAFATGDYLPYRRTGDATRTAPLPSPLLPPVGTLISSPPAPPAPRIRPEPPPTSRRGLLIGVLAATVLLFGGAAAVVFLSTPGPTDPVRLPLPSGLVEATDAVAPPEPTAVVSTGPSLPPSAGPTATPPTASAGPTSPGMTPPAQTGGPGTNPGGPGPTIVPTLPPTTGNPVPTTKAPPPPPRLTATYRTLSYGLQGGYTGEITVANPGPGDAGPWQLILLLPDGETVTDATDAKFSQDGNKVTFTNGRGVPEDGHAVFYFTVIGGNEQPIGCAIDGHAC